MSKIELAESLQQDINELKGILVYNNYELTKEQATLQARAILSNLEDHLAELFEKFPVGRKAHLTSVLELHNINIFLIEKFMIFIVEYKYSTK